MIESKPLIYDPSFVPTNIYGGTPSFLNLSIIEKKEELKGFDVAVMGVPWEGGCTLGGYSTVVVAPKAVRAASIRYTGYLPEFDLDSLEYLKAGDYGDCAVKNGDYDFTFASVREKIGDIVDAGAVPIIFGGDHGTSYPLISEFAKRHPKKVGIIQFDAHCDNYDTYGDDQYSRCSPFFNVYNDPNVDPTKLVHVGIRGPRNHRMEGENRKKYGAAMIPSMEVKKNGWEASIKKAIAIASEGTEAIYVSICADALDAAFIPQGPQDMMGLTSFELMMMLRECGLAGASAFDFMEIYPETSGPQTSAHVACWAALYFLSGLAERRKSLK